ncbi:PREDICTED: solute carrier family 12 member 9-like [Acropora digitifera]|uniref:solute carrier family 12 member 9-like n=1 Tax=Acropora digitifera TaxID=70779 RepID=UPI00077A621C|nr:PREDICTED: solute carrier family 12 member 9-like [Acropora digitifera]
MTTSDNSPAPSLGRYTLLPSTSSLDSLSEERQNGLSNSIPSEGYSVSPEMTHFAEQDELQLRSLPVTEEEEENQRNKLSAFFGVVVPVTLSMFSVILFLRLGFIVGQVGMVVSIIMFIIAYFVVGLTVLSISAIATNGAVKEGGAYYMISRTLGPEFGGSIGIIFYFANIFASALYLLGFVEALMNSFGPSSDHHLRILHEGRWWLFLYGSVILLLCLIICLIGAGMFAKMSFIIYLIVLAAVASSFVSFIIKKEDSEIQKGAGNNCWNGTLLLRYSGWSSKTFRDNLRYHPSVDYTTKDCKPQNALLVFGVLFNGVTGIMAGANISGDLKKPGYAIPFGTLAASIFTFVIYILLVIFTSATCTPLLLKNNYNYLEAIDKVGPLITAGAFAATLSAALSCLLGASRILQAMAKDDLLGILLRPFGRVTQRRREPLRAVLMSWFFVQIVLLIGNLNEVAVLVSMFFLLSYGITNMACFALKVASAPNFRPTFQYFSWQSALLGTILCFVIMFLVNYKYAVLSVAVMVILFVVISLRTPPTPWGDVSQALIYHQVRKYLLRLDLRKDHVKFWRPQVLLLVSNPRSSYPLIDFVNDIKKGGLYILGHVQEDEFNSESMRKQRRALATWLNFVDCTGIKAFVELTVTKTIRAGAQNLLMASGLGGMKPNTLVLGFYDHELPRDNFSRGVFKKRRFPWMRNNRQDEIQRSVQLQLPPLRTHRHLFSSDFLAENHYYQMQQDSLAQLLAELRIPAEVRMIHISHEALSQTRNADGLAPATNWYKTVNQLMQVHSSEAFVVFTGLPHPPIEENMAQTFVQDLTVLSDNLPPVMMVYGKSPVVSTSL